MRNLWFRNMPNVLFWHREKNCRNDRYVDSKSMNPFAYVSSFSYSQHNILLIMHFSIIQTKENIIKNYHFFLHLPWSKGIYWIPRWKDGVQRIGVGRCFCSISRHMLSMQIAFRGALRMELLNLDLLSCIKDWI